jgi:proteasome lid subunit RPN8/RPN11
MRNHLKFQLEGACWSLQFASEAAAVMCANAQATPSSVEAVGQLYTRDLTGSSVLIECATLLKPRRASRGRVQFDPKGAYTERAQFFKQGFHCLGIWHTHPEPHPSPSAEDRLLARDYAIAAKPALCGIVFVIVGTQPLPGALRVWVDDGENLQITPAEIMHSNTSEVK